MSKEKSFMDDVLKQYNKIKMQLFIEKKGPLTKEDNERAMAAAMDSIFTPEQLEQITEAVKK